MVIYIQEVDAVLSAHEVLGCMHVVILDMAADGSAATARDGL